MPYGAGIFKKGSNKGAVDTNELFTGDGGSFKHGNEVYSA